jgi:haloalkane dehalogenase
MSAADVPARPKWLPENIFPFQSRHVVVDGANVHYVDEGEGPVLLLMHGNPTYSFLYRELITGLQNTFRCIAIDYPGFGLSTAPPGYRFTPAEHADVIEKLVKQLDLTGITMMVTDGGGTIGFAVATRNGDRFSAFIIGNTWAWPKSDPGTAGLLADTRRPDRPASHRKAQPLRRADHPRRCAAQEAPPCGDGCLPRAVPDK